MELELVTIGNELLLGYTLDTNAAHIALALAAHGVRVTRCTTVPDEPPAIRGAVTDALERTGCVITTGGLGPTRDDVTKSVVAELFGAPLELDADYLEALRRRFERAGRDMPASNRSQAEIPRGAVALPNPRGTAPGIWLEGAPGTVVLLPGVPAEMRHLIEHEVAPRMAARASSPHVTRSLVLRTTGIPESALAERLESVEERIAPVTMAYLPSVEGVDLRLTAWLMPPEAADDRLDAAAALVTPLLGDTHYGRDEEDLAAVVLAALRDGGHRLAVAESCTGGLVGARITAVPGASDVFVGGVVVYANETKESALGVPAEVLATHGAVSEPVALAMLDGLTERLGVSAAASVTGIAGPDGGTPEKPVGTVWLGARVGPTTKTVRVILPGDRDAIRQRAAQGALNLLRQCLSG